MKANNSFSRANQDRARSRATMKKFAKSRPRKGRGIKQVFNFFGEGYSEYRMRRITPFAFLIYAFAFLFVLSWKITTSKTFINSSYVNLTTSDLGDIELSEGNTIYYFKASQQFTLKTPLYSELEIEILDENFDHVYSVYKVLWQEQYRNDNSRLQTYSDLDVEFEIEIKKAGKYHFRAISYDNNTGPVTLRYYSKSGSIYFGFYAILFLVLSVMLIAMSDSIGSPFTMFASLGKIKDIKQNITFIKFAAVVILIYVSCVIISYTHYGYPSSGDEITLPTYFYGKGETIYLG